MARKTFYRGFSARLQDLLQYTSQHRGSMEALGSFSSSDKAALTTLLNALNAAREYFPTSVELP